MGNGRCRKELSYNSPVPPAQSNSIIYEQRWNTAPPWRAILASVSHGCVLLGLGYEVVSPE